MVRLLPRDPMRPTPSLLTIILLALAATPLSVASSPPQEVAQADLADCIGPIQLSSPQVLSPSLQQETTLAECIAELLDDPLVQDLLDCISRLLSPTDNSASLGSAQIAFCDSP